MNIKKFKHFSMTILVFLFFHLLSPEGAIGAKNNSTKKNQRSIPEKSIDLKDIKGSKDNKNFKDWSGEDVSQEKKSYIMVGFSGGFFKAMGNIGKVMKPGISGKGFIQYNGFFHDSTGVEFETGYTLIDDKDYKSDNIQFLWCIPSITYTVPNIPIIDVQIKAGLGGTYTKSKQMNNNNSDTGKSSIDLTPGFGMAIMKTLNDKFIFGIEGKFYYFIEKENTSAVGAYLFFGVKL